MAAKPRKGPQEEAEAATVRMSEALRAEAKAYAAHQRKSLREVIDEAVSEYLKRKRGA